MSTPGFGAMTVVLLLILIAVPIAASVWRQRQIDRLEPGSHPGLPVATSRLGEIRQQEQGNTIVYSGYNPFVGSGYVMTTWRFAQRLLRSRDPGVAFGPATEADREFVEPPFTTREVVDHLRQELVQLINDPVAERRLPGLTVTDRVFLAGNEVTSLSPYTPDDRVLEFMRTPTAAARHYLVCQVVWRGEVVSTVYVHVAVQGRTLYLEFTAAALPPCDDRYRFVDMIGGTGRLAKARAGLRGLVDAPRTVGLAPFNLLRRGWRAMARAWSDVNLGRMRPGYDYGARMSVRELAMARDTRTHVQSQDILKHHRIIERRTLAAVLDFLDGRGVDTSEYHNQAATVLNAGVVMTGGTLNNQGEMNVNQNNTAAPASGGGKG